MAYIGKKPSTQFGALAFNDTFTGDGSTTTFDVTEAMPNGGDFDVTVVVDNVRQEAGATKSYTIGADGNGDIKRITFNVAPDDGSEIYVINPGRQSSLLTVSDNTVSTAKLQADAVTGAKLADDAVDSEHLVDGSVDNVHLANSSITINGTAVSLGGSVTAGTDWQAVTVADGSTQLTAVAGKGYFLDTNTGVIEVLLPTSPSRGDTIVLADYGGNFSTNNVIVNAGSNLIDSVETVGLSQGYTLSTNNLVVELVYVDSSKGWLVQENEAKSSLTASADTNAKFIAATGGTVTTSGDFKVHVFTGDGCFVVSCAGNTAGSDTVDYLVVAGGGASSGGPCGGARESGGGGAGGFRVSNSYSLPGPTTSPLASPTGLPVPVTTYPITVGGGGASASGATKASNGSNSVFSTITSAGGGAGGVAFNPCASKNAGSSGGSGGGGSQTPACSTRPGGDGNTPPVSPSQGNDGGSGRHVPGCNAAGGGGGGAACAGQNAAPPTPGKGKGGDGGIGSFISTCFSLPGNGTPGPVSGVRYFAGGGGGGSMAMPAPTAGGKGGGGDGATSPSTAGTAGTANTGGGGGGHTRDISPATANAGGKGIVIIRYKFQ